MPLTADELSTLRDALTDSFDDLASFEELALLGVERAADEFAPREGISFRLLKLIKWADDNEKIPTLFAYLRKQEAYQNVAKLRVAVDGIERSLKSRLAFDLMSPQEPFEALFVYKEGRPFIDRQNFRDHLSELDDEFGNRILVIKGERKTGKSHSRYFIEMLKIKRVIPRCAVIDLSPGRPLSGVLVQPTPLGIMQEIDRQLELPDLGPPTEQQNVDAQYNQELFKWLIHKIEALAEPNWIVFDGCSNPDLPPETCDLLLQFPGIVAEYMTLTRLVLLDYEYDQSFDELEVEHDEENLSLLEKEHLIKFFNQLHVKRGLPCTDSELEVIVDEILAKLPAQPEKWMGVLMRESRKKAFEILKSTHSEP